jgi:hypothetical protein
MLFCLAIVAACGPAEDRVVGFWPTKRRAVPSAPGVGRIRHPVSGAARQPRLLYGNLLQTRRLAFSCSPWFRPFNLWFPYGNLLILLGVWPRPFSCL